MQKSKKPEFVDYFFKLFESFNKPIKGEPKNMNIKIISSNLPIKWELFKDKNNKPSIWKGFINNKAVFEILCFEEEKEYDLYTHIPKTILANTCVGVYNKAYDAKRGAERLRKNLIKALN